MTVTGLTAVDPSVVQNLRNTNPDQIEANIRAGIWTLGADGQIYTTQATGVGTKLEKQEVAQPKNVISTTTSTTFPMSNLKALIEQEYDIKVDDAELAKALQDAKIEVDGNGNVKYTSENKPILETALSKYVSSKGATVVGFTEDTDAEAIQGLVKDGVIQQKGEEYEVLKREALDKALPDVVEPETTEQLGAKSISFKANSTTATERYEDPVEVPDDLKHNKSGRKQLRKDYEAVLKDWVKDPKNADTIEYSLAGTKYDKKVTKQMAKIDKEVDRNADDVLRRYYERYATQQEKAFIDKMLAEVSKPENDAELLAAWNRSVKHKGNHLRALDTPEQRQLAAYAKITEDNNFNKNVLLERMAIADVMGARSAKQKAKDLEYFIEEEAKRQVKGQQAEQTTKASRVFFSEAQMKNALGNGVRKEDATFLDKKAMKLVQECPTTFCKDGTPSDYDFTRTYKDPKTGEPRTAYYKFDENKWKDFLGKVCDSRLLDDRSQENFMADKNMTLNEGRSGVMDFEFIRTDEYGQPHRTTFDKLIGNNNGKVGNGELNRIRHWAQDAGFTTDKNKTAGKRVLHVLKGAGIAAALGFGSAFLGPWALSGFSLAGKAYGWATDAKQIAYKAPDRTYQTTIPAGEITGTVKGGQTITWNSPDGEVTFTTDPQTVKTDPQTIVVDGQTVTIDPSTIEFTTEGYVITGTTEGGTVQFTVPTSEVGYNGTITTTDYVDGDAYTHTTPYSGTVQVGGETYEVHYDGQQYTVNVDGKTYQVPVPGQTITTPPQTITVQGQTITIPGKTYTVPVSGQEYTIDVGGKQFTVSYDEHTGKINVIGGGDDVYVDENGKLHVKGQEGEVTADGEKGEVKADNDILKNAIKAATLAAVGGAIGGLATMGKVHAKGRSFDGVVNLRQKVVDEDTEEQTLNLNIAQSRKRMVRAGQISKAQDVPTVKPVRYRGPEAYSVLYETSDGKPIDKKTFAKAISDMWKADYERVTGEKPTGPMPDNLLNIYSEIDLGNGIKLKRRPNFMDIYRTITVGTDGGRRGFQASQAQEGRNIYAQGTLRYPIK